MQQVLFHIPILGVPVYGYGLMLFLAFIGCQTLAKYLCRREGINPNLIPDLTICLFIFGIVGGRFVFVVQYWKLFPAYYWNSLTDNLPFKVISLWDGGLVLYGALMGGALGYFAYYWFRLRLHGVSNWKMLDVIAPCVALGVAFGRIGCLLTGCCYGNVAGEVCPVALHFPYGSPGQSEMTSRGYQTPFGFLFQGSSLVIDAVEPGSAAAESGLRRGDEIVEVNGEAALGPKDVFPTAGFLALKVAREGQSGLVSLPAFVPRSIGLNPTQPYETISMCLLLFLLLSYYPYKRHDGELMVMLMIAYSVHRFLNEMLRTDTDPVAFGLTLSQNISIGILAAGLVLGIVVWRRPLARPVEVSDGAAAAE